jgi:hypothetical protein
VLADVTSLHNVIDELQATQKDVVHSMTNQVTYIKTLHSTVDANVQAIVNLSAVVKDVVVQAHDKFTQITRDILWLNVTLYHQSELYVVIRQLEFAVLQLTQQLDELMDAVQCALLGKLSISAVNPRILRDILTNVTVHLPEGYELLAGTRTKNIYMYYDLAEVTVVGDLHRIQLVIHVPLKTANHVFELYKIVALPARISDQKLVEIRLDYGYFAIDHVQRNYILFTDMELRDCMRGSITVCHADRAVYSTQELTCESSLYLQKAGTHNLCRRRLLLNYETPTLQRHGAIWIYYFPTQQLVTVRCRENGTWSSSSEKLVGGGLLYNASGCAISASGFQTLPSLQGDFQASPDATHLYVPDKVTLVADHELQLLEKALPPDVRRLDDIAASLQTPQTVDMGSLLHFQTASVNSEHTTRWYFSLLAVLCSFLTVGFLSYFCYSLVSYYRRPNREPAFVSPEPTPTSDSHEPSTHAPEPQPASVTFTGYPLR